MNCEVCKKYFTGIECFQQHVASEKHKRNVSQHNNSIPTDYVAASASIPEKSVNVNTFPCTTCAMIFKSLSEFIEHTGTKDHALMILREKDTNSNVEDCDSTSNLKSQSNLLANDKFKATTFWQQRCEKCDKILSGPEPYRQHINSFEHKKKCGLLTAIEVPENAPTATSCSLSCTICGVTLSGPIPYEAHIRGIRHQKKAMAVSHKLNENSKENNSDSVDNASDIEQPKKTSCLVPSLAYYCDICDIRCSGVEPYREHLKGRAHAKKMLRKEAVSKQNELQNLLSGQTSSLVSSIQTSEHAASHSEVEERSNSFGNAATGDLGEDVKKTLYGEDWDAKTSTPSTLSLTFFAVGEEIDFNKTSKTQIGARDLEIVDIKEEDENEAMEE